MISDQPYQLPLGILSQEDFSFGNFIQGDNAEAVSAVKALVAGDQEPFVYLWGRGRGCSHLLHAACAESESCGVPAVYFPLNELADYGPVVLEGLEKLPLVCLDRLDHVAGDDLWEESLFHLFNRLQLTGSRLLVAARVPPQELGVLLPDLSSRLQWGLVYGLQALDDEQKAALLVSKSLERGVQVPDEVIRYLLTRSNRDTKSLLLLLERIDQISLREQRRVTLPFVREMLAQEGGRGE